MFPKILLFSGTLFCLKTSSFLVALSQMQLSNEIPFFYGDITFENYLQTEICSQFSSDQMKYSIILVQNFDAIKIPTKQLFFKPYLHCFHLIINLQTLNLTVLMSKLKVEKKLQHTKWLMLFYLDQKINYQKFHLLIVQLDELYWECNRCRPFIIRFSESFFQNILDWSIKSLKLTRQNFKSSLTFSNSLNIIHIRPTYGCLISQTVMTPKTTADFLTLKKHYKCDLQKSILNVSLNHIPPFCNLIVHSNNSIQISSKNSIEIEFLKSFMKKFNFQVNLVYAQQTWGHIDLKTGKINGMISQVFQGTSQLGLCHISRALERLYFVDYSHFTYLDPITFLSPMPGIKAQNWIIAKPFHLQTWIGVILSLFFLSITIYWSYKNIILKYQTSIGYWGKYSVILVKLYAILLGQPTKLHHWKANDAIKLIFVVWLFVSLTINRSYGGVFFAFLTVPEFGSVIDSMAQLMSLVKSDQVTIITNGLYTKRFIHSGPESPVYFDLGLHINRTNPKSFNLYENSVKQLKNLEKLKHPIPVYIQTRILLSSVSYIYGKNKFHVGSENINIDFTGVIMSKRSPLKKHINRAILQLQEGGLSVRWTFAAFEHMRGYFHSKYISAPEPKSHHLRLTFFQLHSVYYFWSFGLIAACCLLLLEMALEKWSLERMEFPPHRRNAAAFSSVPMHCK